MAMELHLARPNTDQAQVIVTCDGAFSHTFDLQSVIPTTSNGLPHPLKDPLASGKALSAALFPPDSLASGALAGRPARILLMATDEELDAIPWEYACGPDGLLACRCSLVRGLPKEERMAPPGSLNGLHIVAVASSPLSHHLAPLNVEGEWMRLTEIIYDLDRAVRLERAWPPTIERLRDLVVDGSQRVVHFMGHGGPNAAGEAVFCFEREDGRREDITARELVARVGGSVFLVTLNACQSATPGEVGFGNLARALVREGVPYALGMRFSVYDEDALAFSRAFYRNLARGVAVEEALRQARLTMAKSACPWAAGNIVLYTSLTGMAPGHTTAPGEPDVRDAQEDALRGIVGALPEMLDAFQGRIDEQIRLGAWLTGDSRPRIMTIHGSGGQGKTALARVAAQRFAHAWPGGVWAFSLETLPTRALFVAGLARFVGINPQESADLAGLERQILLRLRRRRTLLVLDNIETLEAAARNRDAEALALSEFIQQLPGERTSLLCTSQHLQGWPGEQALELSGLSPEEGAALFAQSAPTRAAEIDLRLAEQLSRCIDGHPLGLSLLGKAFNEIGHMPLVTFLAEHETHLRSAENLSIGVEHRQRTLWANVAYSVSLLTPELRETLGKLWVFHAPFVPERAVRVLDAEYTKSPEASPVEQHLYALWQRGLLVREALAVGNERVYLYQMPPVIRPFVEERLAAEQERGELLRRFGAAEAWLARDIYHKIVRGRAIAALALRCYDDLARGVSFVEGIAQGYYLLHWGWILHWLGDQPAALALTERALELAEGQDRALEGRALHNLAMLTRATGHPHDALRLDEQALQIRREVGDRAGEGTTLNNLGRLSDALGQKQQARDYYQQAQRIQREVGDRAGEGTTLNNLGTLYREFGQFDIALACFLAAKAIFASVQSPDINVVMRWIEALGQTLGEEFFAALLAQVEPRIDELVERAPLGKLPSLPTLLAKNIALTVHKTIAVMTATPKQRAEWRKIIAQLLQKAQEAGSVLQSEAEFFTAILALLEGQPLPALAADHPYVPAITAIQDGIAKGAPQMGEEDDGKDEEERGAEGSKS